MCKAIFTEESKKLKIFLHVLEPYVVKTNIVSSIYQLEMDTNILENLSLRSCNAMKPSSSSSSLPMIKPIFRFYRKVKSYPSGMSCVRLGSKLYLMGGSLSYTPHLLKVSCYDMDFRGGKYDNGMDVPISNFLKEDLTNYPPDVCVFDCNTCTLLPDNACPSMLSGKSENPLTFVADGQIFVLSTTKVRDDMIIFESLTPGQQQWKKLAEPPQSFFYSKTHPIGCTLIKDKFLLTFGIGRKKYILSYDINSDEWTSRDSYQLPLMSVDSIFVNNNIYLAGPEPARRGYFKNKSPVLCFGPLKSTEDGVNLDFVAQNQSKKVSYLCKHISACSKAVRNWPIYINQSGHSTKCLFHLGGLLKGTQKHSRFFGLVELFDPYPPEYEAKHSHPPCELRFVAFQALQSANVEAEFPLMTIHESRFSTEVFGTGTLNAACAYLA
ncbi:hypothetical protein POM88_010428 [Heracleum sosnowskyi]|uniref:Uncharacterized protein n=1 Tax=Heracleum sosnowskyi TaxID=360622 RepID=A0AAD8ISK8_9APIA|nr:hypothetical protein POM88_010428 [Heracleum sosnowskyi]